MGICVHVVYVVICLRIYECLYAHDFFLTLKDSDFHRRCGSYQPRVVTEYLKRGQSKLRYAVKYKIHIRFQKLSTKKECKISFTVTLQG